jgi:hypothetical protein
VLFLSKSKTADQVRQQRACVMQTPKARGCESLNTSEDELDLRLRAPHCRMPFQLTIIAIACSLTVPIMATPSKVSCFSIKSVAQVDDKVKPEIDMLAELIT